MPDYEIHDDNLEAPDENPTGAEIPYIPPSPKPSYNFHYRPGSFNIAGLRIFVANIASDTMNGANQEEGSSTTTGSDNVVVILPGGSGGSTPLEYEYNVRLASDTDSIPNIIHPVYSAIPHTFFADDIAYMMDVCNKHYLWGWVRECSLYEENYDTFGTEPDDDDDVEDASSIVQQESIQNPGIVEEMLF